MAIHEPPGDYGRIEAMGERLGDIREGVAAALRSAFESAADLTKSEVVTTIEVEPGRKVDNLSRGMIQDVAAHEDPAKLSVVLKESVHDHKGILIVAGVATGVSVAAGIAALRHVRTKKREPTQEETATKVIREHAKREALSEANPDSRFVVLRRPKGHVMGFKRIYHPPTDNPPTAEAFTRAFNHILGGNNFDDLVNMLTESKGVRQAVDSLRSGGRFAIIGDHLERADAFVKQVAVQVAAERLEPGIHPTIIRGSRIIVGIDMAELALRTYDIRKSTVEAMTESGGVFTTFADDDDTERDIKAGLDEGIVYDARLGVAKELQNQIKGSEEVRVVTVVPNGKMNVLRDLPDGQGQEYVLPTVPKVVGRLIGDLDWLPVVVRLQPTGVDCAVGDLIRSTPDIHPNIRMQQAMGEVIAPMCSRLDAAVGIPTRYEMPEPAEAASS